MRLFLSENCDFFGNNTALSVKHTVISTKDASIFGKMRFFFGKKYVCFGENGNFAVKIRLFWRNVAFSAKFGPQRKRAKIAEIPTLPDGYNFHQNIILNQII